MGAAEGGGELVGMVRGGGGGGGRDAGFAFRLWPSALLLGWVWVRWNCGAEAMGGGWVMEDGKWERRTGER